MPPKHDDYLHTVLNIVLVFLINGGNAAILTPFRSRNTTHQNLAFKRSKQCRLLAKVYTKGMRTLHFVKMVEFWQCLVFCERGSRKYQNSFYFAAFAFKIKTSLKKSKVRMTSV